MYSHTEEGIPAMCRAVKAVLWHALDRLDATAEERVRYHQYCGAAWCGFKKWVMMGNTPESYTKTTKKDQQGKEVPWTGGHFKRIDLDFPAVFKKLEDIFETLGSEILLSRCTKKVTQNINESVHSKLWRRVLKFKKHGANRYRFCCVQVAMEHNFGKKAGSLLNCLGAMSAKAEHDLSRKDEESHYVAARKHTLLPGGNRTKLRRKIPTKSSYDGGNEPLQ